MDVIHPQGFGDMPHACKGRNACQASSCVAVITALQGLEPWRLLVCHQCVLTVLLPILALSLCWGCCSIGWSVGATLGYSLAAEAMGKRLLSFIGDGSFQVNGG